MSPPKRDSPILIVGAGVFGLSTALALHERGYTDITIIDRYPAPVPDGSSVDTSRIIRPDYTDPFYSRLAAEAVELWKSSDLYRPHFHNSGFLLTSEDPNDPYLEKARAVLKSQSLPYQDFRTTEEIRRTFPGLKETKSPFSGYMSQSAGWADAAGAVQAVARHLAERGVSFITGPRGTMQSLIIDNSNQVSGVKVATGPPLHASQVILATGAWTNIYLNLDYTITGSAQPLAFIQLTASEAKSLANIPVVIDKDTGVFFFPPTPDNLLKVAYHGHGFEVEVPLSDGNKPDRTISAPSHEKNNAASGFLPEDANLYLRAGLKNFVPQFASRPWQRTRLCWYTETPTGDFIAAKYHSVQGLFIATGGSGQ